MKSRCTNEWGGKADEDAPGVTIRTNKFEEELAFYKEIVGLKIVRDLRERGRGIVFLADSEGDTCIEIINTPDGDNAGNKLLSIKRSSRVPHP